MSFELFVALRYLFARRKQAFISLISLISTIGVAVGVMALIIALALMTGLQGELRDRILSSQAHIYVWKTGGITDYAPRWPSCARCRRRRRRARDHRQGADRRRRCAGVHQRQGDRPRARATVTDIKEAMQQGSLDALANESEDQPPAILIGEDLAKQLGVRLGDSVTLVTPQGTLSPMGMIPRTRRARVAGIYTLGLYEFDSSYGFVSLPFGERLMGKDAADLIQLRVTDICDAPRIADDVTRRLGPDVRRAGLVRPEPVALLGALAGEDGHLDRHRPDRHGRGAEHRRVAHPAGDGEEPRHRHPEDDGDVAEADHDDLHDAGADHRHRRDGGRGASAAWRSAGCSIDIG